MKPLVDLAVKLAMADVGVREVPENRGPRITEYLASCGLGPGYAYCAAAVNFWIQQAETRLHVPDIWPNFAYCPDISRWASKQGILREVPEPGDVMLLYGQSKTGYRAHHTGLVIEVLGGLVRTVEANTNDNGSSEGIGVYQKDRGLANLKFVQWSALISSRQAGEDGKTYHLSVLGQATDLTVVTRQGRTFVLAGPLFKALDLAYQWNNSTQRFWVKSAGEIALDLITDTAGQHLAPIRQVAEELSLKITIVEDVISLT